AGELRRGHYDKQRLEERLEDRGFMTRFFLGGFFRMISKSWHMYPLGILFGLGFDTATEVGLLALAAGVANHAVPFLAVLSLPILFAAGISFFGTAHRAFLSPGLRLGVSQPRPEGDFTNTRPPLSVGVVAPCG